MACNRFDGKWFMEISSAIKYSRLKRANLKMLAPIAYNYKWRLHHCVAVSSSLFIPGKLCVHQRPCFNGLLAVCFRYFPYSHVLLIDTHRASVIIKPKIYCVFSLGFFFRARLCPCFLNFSFFLFPFKCWLVWLNLGMAQPNVGKNDGITKHTHNFLFFFNILQFKNPILQPFFRH